MDGKRIGMNRRAIHITRKPNHATNYMDCAVIRMGLPRFFR
jgi:hypothetical protein